MWVIALIALATGAVMLVLAWQDIRDQMRKPHWRLRRSFDVIALSVGFICQVVVAGYSMVLLWIAP